MNVKCLVSEFVGTFALILIGAGAAALATSVVPVALAHGLVVVGFAYAYGHLSGVHINPAVTFGVWVAKEIKFKEALTYWASQFAGGIAGAFTLRWFLSGMDTGLGATVLSQGIGVYQGMAIEAVLTFFLVNAVLNAAISGKAGQFAGLSIGLTLIFCILMGGTLTGASLNPARTLGPALASCNFADIWLYFVGPLLGAGVAGLLYLKVLKK